MVVLEKLMPTTLQQRVAPRLSSGSRLNAMLSLSRNLTCLHGARRTLFTSSVLRNAKGAVPKDVAKPATASSCPAGTVLNLKIKKSGAEPVALEDHEYPEWLWSVLDKDAQQARLDADPAKKAKKEMRSRNKKQIKLNNFMTQMK